MHDRYKNKLIEFGLNCLSLSPTDIDFITVKKDPAFRTTEKYYDWGVKITGFEAFFKKVQYQMCVCVCVYLCVCMYVCTDCNGEPMYVYIRVYMYVCVDVCMYVWTLTASRWR